MTQQLLYSNNFVIFGQFKGRNSGVSWAI